MIDRKKIKDLLKEFINICEENQIWYSADASTLLGVVRHAGFVPWVEKIEIMMTIESFEALKRFAKGRIADSSTNPKIEDLCAYFVKDNKDVESEQPFIQIRIAVPTTTLKAQKIRKISYLFGTKVKKKPINIKSIINELYDKKFEGFMLLESRKQDIVKNWIQVLSFDTFSKKFNGIEIKVPVEYKRILTDWLGPDYMNAKVPSAMFEYYSPTHKKKVDLNEN